MIYGKNNVHLLENAIINIVIVAAILDFQIFWKSRARIRRLNDLISSFAPREAVYQIWCFCPPGKNNVKRS